jgi:hypothetical protein
MSWENLAKINSVDMRDMDEYHSRPDDRVLKLLSQRKSDIVIYGARGKFSRHISLMLLRAIRETNTSDRKVYLISSPRQDETFDRAIKPYMDFARQYHVDLLNAKESDLHDIPNDKTWVLYLAGYKFAKPGEGDRDYKLKCDLYGKVIPSLVFIHHQEKADIVVMGSYNGLEKTPIDKPAKDDYPLQPLPENHYGQSILDKERVLHAILKGRDLFDSSKAVILRGGYYTDASTYGGLEPEILKIMKGQEIDLSQKSYFNLLSHRDAAIATILSVQLATKEICTRNLSGHLVDVRNAVKLVTEELRNYSGYSDIKPKITGSPEEAHLLADGSALEKEIGKPIDSIDDIIHAHIYWIINNGYRRGIEHKIGKNI